MYVRFVLEKSKNKYHENVPTKYQLQSWQSKEVRTKFCVKTRYVCNSAIYAVSMYALKTAITQIATNTNGKTSYGVR